VCTRDVVCFGEMVPAEGARLIPVGHSRLASRRLSPTLVFEDSRCTTMQHARHISCASVQQHTNHLQRDFDASTVKKNISEDHTLLYNRNPRSHGTHPKDGKDFVPTCAFTSSAKNTRHIGDLVYDCQTDCTPTIKPRLFFFEKAAASQFHFNV
jgi:hypothetical protein